MLTLLLGQRGHAQRPRVPPGMWSGGSEGYVVMMQERLQDTAFGPRLAARASCAPVPLARSREPSPGRAAAANHALVPAAVGRALSGPARPAPAAPAAGTDGCAGGGGGRCGAAAAGRGVTPGQPSAAEPAGGPGGASAPAEEPGPAPGVPPASERAVERGAAAAGHRPRRRGREARKRRRGAEAGARDAGSPATSDGPGAVSVCDAAEAANAPLGHASADVSAVAQMRMGGCDEGACGEEGAIGARRVRGGRGARGCASAARPVRRARSLGLTARAVRGGCTSGDAGRAWGGGPRPGGAPHRSGRLSWASGHCVSKPCGRCWRS